MNIKSITIGEIILKNNYLLCVFIHTDTLSSIQYLCVVKGSRLTIVRKNKNT